MTFSFGQTKSSTTFGANTGSSTNTGNTGLFGNTTSTFGKSASTGGGLFGNTNTAATTASTNLFNTSTANSGTSLFGNTSTNTSTSGTGLFGNTNTGTSLFGNSSTGTSGGLFGNTNTNQSSGGLFGNTNTNQNANQQQTTNQPHNQLLLTARALSQPQLFGDERDQIVAKFNQILASWGTGKAYYSRNGDKIDLTPSNHFCRFKTVGYACLPTAKDEDGLVWLIIKKPVAEGLKNQVADSLHQIFNKNPNITVVVEGIRAVGNQKTEITIYVKEQKPDGTTRKVPASELANGLNQQNVKNQLQTSIGLEEVIVRTSLTDSQVKQLLESPPACIDPVIWKQAISMNPDEKKMIPVPMLGFSALHQRLKLQEEMSKGHSNRSELLQREIRELQEKQANTKAKIEERKRNLLELSHRILEVTIHQEVQRKAGLAIQTEEEQLRAQLEALNNQLRAPTQFRGRLNELLSQIRMQGEFHQRSSSGSVSLEDAAVQDIKNHLQKQQAGLNHMIERMKSAFTDLQTIETGLIETENRRN